MTDIDACLDIPECVPARILNEYAYCPRLAYIEWVQADFAESFETVDGRYRHRVVHEEGGELPAEPSDEETIHARSVWLSAPEEHITSRIDLVEGKGTEVTVVDYKRGKAPENEERSWEADRVQVCAQALVLRANGYTCQDAILYYVGSKSRISVPLHDALVERTRRLVCEAREMARAGRIPPPLDDSPKCPGCSLSGICLPDETNLLAVSETPGYAEEEDAVRRLIPARDDSLPLYVQENGATVGKEGETFVVKLRGEKLGESRIFETSQICVFGTAHLTTPALKEAMSRNIPVAFFSTGGWFVGLAHGMVHKNVELRIRQFEVARDDNRSLSIATRMIAAKIENSRTLLMRNHPQLPEGVPKQLSTLAEEARSCSSAASLLGIEGAAARLYYWGFGEMLRGRGGHEEEPRLGFDFQGRNRRPPRDPVNAMLSYAYAVLAKDLTATALTVGFDPFLGFFHKPRYGRPSLALDLMEEFRPIVADSVVLGVVNNGTLTPADFTSRGPSVALTPTARKKLLKAYERRMDTLITHPVFGYRVSYRRILEVQVRLLGRVLSGEVAEYPAFTTR